ncbi:MAG: FMN-binding glutamate synthase family protein [Actinomycetota bacterium]
MAWWIITLIVIGAAVVLMAIRDLTQKKDPVLRTFPVAGRFRSLLGSAGPKLRQYIVASNDEERPFSRDQRRWVYDTADKKSAYFGFGTDADIDRDSHVIIKHSVFPDTTPIGENAPVPCAKVLGEWRERPGKFRPESVVYVSAMSYGSLSGRAVEAINRGCDIAGALHNTGEGGIADHHRHGAGLMFQFGTGYFGCRNPDGSLSIGRLAETAKSANVRCIEMKLSQGAKPGLGGVLPGKKVTAEIAEARGLPKGQTVYSPNRHTAFDSVDGMIDVIEQIADATGLPVGIKSAVGQQGFWTELAERMATRQEGPDFITVDGGEGGTGAAPLAFSDHVSLPFRAGFARAYTPFVERDLHTEIVFGGSGRLGFPAEALLAFGLGVDMVGVAREALLALGCIQAQRCHDGHCPTGITTHNRWLTRGLDPTDKATRLANYLVSFRSELLKLSHACGVVHPALVTADMIEIFDQPHEWATAAELFGGSAESSSITGGQQEQLHEVMVELGHTASSH